MHATASRPVSAARHHPARRASDATRVAIAAGRGERFALVGASTQSPHMRGWVAYALGRQLPVDACADMHAGYAEARNCAISQVTAREPAQVAA